MSPKLKQTISLFNSSKISSANSILSAKQMKPLDNNQRTSPTRYSSGQSRVQQTQVKDLSAIQNNNKEDEEEEATISFDSLLKDTIDGIVKRCDHSKTIQTSITYRNPTSNTQNTRQASYELSTSTSNLTDNQPPYSLNSPESDESNVSLHSSTESAYNPTSLDQDVDNHELKSENSFLERSDLASSFPSVIRRQYDRIAFSRDKTIIFKMWGDNV
ncbi:hypothetical protein FBU30_007994 [Linnemannia zychae]|nr:hypothetical protein FBU30_007994 [Linnemannia zychae]